MKPFVEMFLDFTKEYESPTSFFRWAAYSAVAATLRDNVWIQQGHRKTFPNIYTLLLATSAVHRKSVPTGLVGDLLTEVSNTKVIRGRISIQAVVQELAGATTDRNTGQAIRGGSCLLCAEELAAFIVQDPSTIPILTDLYDTRKEWESTLIGRGKSVIKNLCVTMLAASNEQHLKDVYTEQAIYGGLLGRTFFVTPSEFRKANPLLKSEKERYSTKELIDSLKVVSKLKGEMRFEEGVIDEYTTWYENFRESYKDKPDRTGVAGRIHTGVIKLAIILGVANNYELIIKSSDMEESITQCLSILPNYDQFTMGKGKSPISEASALFLNSLYEAKQYKMTMKDILFKHWSDFDKDALTHIVDTLENAGMIQTTIAGSSTITYSLTQKSIDIFKNTNHKGRK